MGKGVSWYSDKVTVFIYYIISVRTISCVGWKREREEAVDPVRRSRSQRGEWWLVRAPGASGQVTITSCDTSPHSVTPPQSLVMGWHEQHQWWMWGVVILLEAGPSCVTVSGVTSPLHQTPILRVSIAASLAAPCPVSWLLRDHSQQLTRAWAGLQSCVYLPYQVQGLGIVPQLLSSFDLVWDFLKKMFTFYVMNANRNWRRCLLN